MSGGGTLIQTSRALRPAERRYLWRRWALFRGGQAAIAEALLAFLAWAMASEDDGLRFLFVLLAVPALLGIRYLHGLASTYGRDLRSGRVQSVVGAVGSLDLTAALVPLHLGERTFYIQAHLLARKRQGDPILVEYLTHTGLAVAIDGKSNLMTFGRWMRLAGVRAGGMT